MAATDYDSNNGGGRQWNNDSEDRGNLKRKSEGFGDGQRNFKVIYKSHLLVYTLLYILNFWSSYWQPFPSQTISSGYEARCTRFEDVGP